MRHAAVLPRTAPSSGPVLLTPATGDVVVVGAGLVGLACALAVADRGGNVTLVGATRQGEASPAAAGMLAPSVERAEGPAHRFAVAARDRFPAYLDALAERSGVRVPLNRLGVLVVAVDHGDARPAEALAAGGAPLSRSELAALEPALAHATGAVLFEDDGAVDNVELLRALRVAVRAHGRIRIVERLVDAIEIADGGEGASVVASDGGRYAASRVVLAAGAWTPGIRGLPRPVPVEPMKGQMLSLATAPLRHVVYGPHGYLVPRADGRTLVGATMERAGFDTGVTDDALAQLRADADALCPGLAGVPRLDAWAGLRPVTPDLLPIIGPDPDAPALVYACGHSRNGVLMAPLTGDVVADIVVDGRVAGDGASDAMATDLLAFSIARFAASPA